jgi:hypothetical protein
MIDKIRIGLGVLAIIVGMTLGLMSSAYAQGAPRKWLSAASTNSTLVTGRRSLLINGVVINTTGTLYYLKLYNKATAPVCGTDVPVWTVPIPFGASSAGGGFTLPLGSGLSFTTGMGFCITSGIADNDTGVAATGIVVNLGVSNL